MTRWRPLILRSLISLLIGWKVLSLFQADGDTDFPRSPIQVVVPYNAGGGTDAFVRLIGKSIADNRFLTQPLVVLNQPGGSGTIGSRFVKDSRPDGYRILCHHESIITSQLSGAVPFGPDDFECIAMSGEIELLVVVREDSPYQTIVDLLEDAKRNPDTIRFGANLGSPAHFTALNLEAAHPGARLNMVTTGGGQKRYISLIGGHLDAGIFSLAEYLSYRSDEGTAPDKNIRALAILSEEPANALREVKTCIQQGVDVTSSNAYYWWAPKGTPPDVIHRFSTALLLAMNDTVVRNTLTEWAIGIGFKRGWRLDDHLKTRIAAMNPPQVESPPELPPYPAFAGGIVLLLVMVVWLEKNKLEEQPLPTTPRHYRKALACLTVLLSYVGLMQWTAVSYSLATSAMILIIGGVIANFDPRKRAVVTEVALLTGFGSEFILTQIFAVSLP